MSVGERSTFNRPFWDKLFHVDFIDPPLRGQEKQSLEQLKKILANSNDVACFIFEPMVQGAGGMLMQEPLALNELIAYARSKGVICIADEVMTGFGRTGKFFALDHIEENSDILCVAKGLTGGVVPLSATLCTERIYESFLSQDKTKAFFHGHSFTANPVGCAASLASMDLLTEPKTMHSIESIASHHQRFCTELSSSPLNRYIKDVRSLGTICALELNTKARGGYFNELADHMKIFFYDQDVLLRPLGNVVYILPPYCSSENELNMAYQVIWNFLECLD
jgi:adenosylmethionine-8-amino-7-oxononanoate aminotransferase